MLPPSKHHHHHHPHPDIRGYSSPGPGWAELSVSAVKEPASEPCATSPSSSPREGAGTRQDIGLVPRMERQGWAEREGMPAPSSHTQRGMRRVPGYTGLAVVAEGALGNRGPQQHQAPHGTRSLDSLRCLPKAEQCHPAHGHQGGHGPSHLSWHVGAWVEALLYELWSTQRDRFLMDEDKERGKRD